MSLWSFSPFSNIYIYFPPYSFYCFLICTHLSLLSFGFNRGKISCEEELGSGAQRWPGTMGSSSCLGFLGTFCRPRASQCCGECSLPIPRMDGWIHPRCLTLQPAWGSQGCSQPAPGMLMEVWVCPLWEEHLEAAGAREFWCASGAGRCREQAAGTGGFIPCMYKCKE